MKLDDNELRKMFIKEFIIKYWKAFVIAIFVVIFLASVVIFVSKKGSQNIVIKGKIVNLLANKTAENREEYFLEVELKNGKIVNVPIKDTSLFKKDRVIEIKEIKNSMLKIDSYRFVKFVEK